MPEHDAPLPDDAAHTEADASRMMRLAAGAVQVLRRARTLHRRRSAGTITEEEYRTELEVLKASSDDEMNDLGTSPTLGESGTQTRH